MKRRNATRSALFTSIISLLLCVSMLVGTTFAWFTDEVKSGVNNIVAGNLDIELEYTKDPTDVDSWDSVDGKTDLFSGALWEPGHTEVVYLRLSNKGTLALNYQLGINVVEETPGENVAGKTFYLSDHILFGVVEDQTTKFADRAAAVTAVTEAKALKAGYTKGTGMIAGDEAYMALVVYMPETVGNEANYKTGTAAPTIQLGVNVVATQKTHEDDSFGKDYDVLAQGGYVSDAAPAEGTTKTYEIVANKGDDEQGVPEEVVIGTMEISSESVENPALPINISVVPTAQDETVVVAADQAASSFEVTVSNIKEDNDKPITVELHVGKGLSNVKLYHKNVLIASDYDTNTGIVTFKTNSFSPFTVVYNVDRNIPQASVNDLGAKDVSATLNGWGNSTAAATYKAPFVLQFTPNESLEEANVSEYKYWHADYVVKADRDVAANSLALMGYYEVFCNAANNNNWVALSADTMIPANTEIRLVDVMGGGDGTGTGGIKVTYKDICQYGNDGTGFLCSAVDLTGANAGTTLTVELRMYAHDGDPSQPSYNGGNETGEYLTIGTYTYTFGVNEVKTADELAAALATGGEVKLVEDITLAQTVKVENDVILDLNGHDFVAETGSRPFQVYGGDLKIIATGSKVELDQYGLVDIREGSDVNVTIIGGTFTGELDNGAVFKGRKNTTAEIHLKDVNMTFTDTAGGSYVYNPDSGAKATTTVDGGVYNIDCGFTGNVTMKNATVNAKGFIFNGGGSIENSTLTTDGSSKAPAKEAPFCCVAATLGRTVTVTGSTLTATNCHAIEVYPTGGTVTVVGSTVNGTCHKYAADADHQGAVISITIDGVEQ